MRLSPITRTLLLFLALPLTLAHHPWIALIAYTLLLAQAILPLPDESF